MNRDGSTALPGCVGTGEAYDCLPEGSVGPDVIGACGPFWRQHGARNQKRQVYGKATEIACDARSAGGPDYIGATGPQAWSTSR